MKRIIESVVCSVLLTISFSSIANIQPSESVDLWHTQGNYFEFEQKRIFYRDSLAGSHTETQTESTEDKPTIVLLHGFPTSSWDWHPIWSLLKDDYRVVTLDFLGFGFSDKPRTGYSIARQADLVEDLLTYLDIRQAHFLVHDYGTFVSQELLARQQSATATENRIEIQTLAMLNGVVDPHSLQLLPIQKALNSRFGWLVSLFASYNRFSRSFSSIFGEHTQPDTRALQDFWYLNTLDHGHRIGHKLIHYYDESLQNSARWVGALSNTDIPVMLITGLADPVAGMPMVEKFLEFLPDQEVHVLEGIGHYPHVEDVESVAHYYLPFLEAYAGKP